MNVLLSRARWRLILVGSKKFLQTILKSAKGTKHEKEVAFLERFLQALEKEEEDGAAVTVSDEFLRGLSS